MALGIARPQYEVQGSSGILLRISNFDNKNLTFIDPYTVPYVVPYVVVRIHNGKSSNDFSSESDP